MNKLLCVVAGFLLLVTGSAFAESGRVILLPDSRAAVIANGDLEGASIGSYSLAIYTESDLIDFVTGAIFARDGSIFMDNGMPRIEFADMNGDGKKELIVTMLTAGSGSYLEVDVLSIGENDITLLAKEKGDNKAVILETLKKNLTNKDIH